jgi:Protein of unknown function (DUF3616)
MRLAICTVLALGISSPSGMAAAPAVSMGRAVDVKRSFVSRDMKNSEQRGISGFACLPPSEPGQRVRTCVAVNDEERFVEWVVLEATTLTPTGRTVQLLQKGKRQKDEVVGTMPRGLCKEADGFKEFDGEAIAITDRTIHVIGSHACSRSGGKFKPSSFVLARFDAAVRTVQRTWRVSDLIRSHRELGLGAHGALGANIEGLAIIGPDAFFGFRTPSAPDGPFILRAPLAPLFAAGAAEATAVSQTIGLKLGRHIGIRDLAALPDGRLLVLTGPAMDVASPYLLHVLTPGTGAVTTLAELRSERPGIDKGGKVEIAKAEAIAITETTPDSVTVIVFHDNIDDGGPRLHTIRLPRSRP